MLTIPLIRPLPVPGFRSSPGFLVIVLFTSRGGHRRHRGDLHGGQRRAHPPAALSGAGKAGGGVEHAPAMSLDQFEHSEGSYLVYRRHNHVLEDLGIYGKVPSP